MKLSRIDFNYTALRPIMGLEPTGSVPSTQKYNAARQEYVPDYVNLPLVLKFRASILDKDGILPGGDINSSLNNVTATMNIDGEETLLQTGSDFTVITQGENAGQVTVKRNMPRGKAVQIRVTADYTDPRTKQVIKFTGSHNLYCNIETINENMFIEGGTTIFNPLKVRNGSREQPEVLSMKAHHRCGEQETEPDADRLKFVWMLKREDGNFTEVGSSKLDYFCKVSGVSGETITIDRSLMRYGYTLKCYAVFSPDGDVANAQIQATTPNDTISCIRKLPKFDYEPVGLPGYIPPGQLYIYPSVAVKTSKAVVENIDDVFDVKWYAAVNTHSSAESFAHVGSGSNPELDTTRMNAERGMLVGVEMVDAGPRMPAVDSDGAIITDSDGSIILW